MKKLLLVAFLLLFIVLLLITDGVVSSGMPVPARPVIAETELPLPEVAENKPEATAQPTEEVVKLSPRKVKLALVSDFKTNDPNSDAVANEIDEMSPDFVLTAGDNGHDPSNYNGLPSVYLKYQSEGKFFPSLGNHDLMDSNYAPFDMNALPIWSVFPMEGRYYSHVFGDGALEVFFLNSNDLEPDGNGVGSVQYNWFAEKARQSTALHKMVILHEPVFASCDRYGKTYNGNPNLRWDFASLGVDLVVSGHCHNYERIEQGSVTYIVVGTGSYASYGFSSPLEGSVMRLSMVSGYLRIEAGESLLVEFVTLGGVVLDRFEK